MPVLRAQRSVCQNGIRRRGISKAHMFTFHLRDAGKLHAVCLVATVGHSGFQPLADAPGGFELGVILRDLVARRDNEVCHAGSGRHCAQRDLTVKHQQQTDKQNHRENQVADQGGVHDDRVQALLVSTLVFLRLMCRRPMPGIVSVLT